MVYKRFITVTIVASLVLGTIYLLGCKSSTQAPRPVRIGYLPIVASLPLFIAQEQGFFKEEHVIVDAIQMASSNQLIEGLISGNLDAITEASAVPFLAAESILPGQIKIFAASAITKETPFDSLVVLNDAEIRDLDDLVGKKIGVFPGSTATNLLKKFLQDNGVDVNNIILIKIAPQNQLSALFSNSIDVLHSYEPNTTIALQSEKARKIFDSVYANMIEPNPQGIAALSAKFINEHPQEAKKIVRAFDKAFDLIISNENVARNILQKYVKVDERVANQLTLLYMMPLEKINKDKMQEYADLLYELAELSHKVDTCNVYYKD